MGLRFPGQESNDCFFVTTSFHNHIRHGNIEGVYDILGDTITYKLDKLDAKMIGYVFMPSHIHLLMIIEGAYLSGFMRDVKKYTAQKALNALAYNGKLWQSRYDRVAITSTKVLQTKLNYIHNNPVKAGLVEFPEAWKYSSAGFYWMEQQGIVPIWNEWRFWS